MMMMPCGRGRGGGPGRRVARSGADADGGIARRSACRHRHRHRGGAFCRGDKSCPGRDIVISNVQARAEYRGRTRARRRETWPFCP